MFTKKNRIGTSPLADFEVPHTIQPGEHSIGSGTEGVMYEWRRAVNANWNDDGWNINANAVDNPNPWNAGNDVVSRYPFLSSLGALSLGEFFAINPLRHPPIIFPTSSIRTLNSSNCLFGISFDSHAICAKNRNESVIPTARVSRGTFSRIPAYVATRNDSSRSSNRVSIFAPMPNRSSRPILRRIGNHKRYNVFVCSTTGKIRAGGGRPRRIQLTHTYENIISVENLLGAWKEFVAGKRKKDDVQKFQSRLMDNILALHRDLKSKTYRHGAYEAFKINDPKPRDISKAIVRDRLVHHAIYSILYPFFDRTFIADSYSCRKEKGTHKAMNRFRAFAYKVSNNHTRTVWVLKCDVRKFFASIDHACLMDIINRYIPDQDIVSLIARIIGSFHSTREGVGLPLGNLTSQLLVNIYMNEFDQFAKHRLKAQHYIRYADDFVLLSTDKQWLENALIAIDDFLQDKLRLTLHPDKISIRTIASGIDFLGWVHFPDHRVLRTSTKKRMFRGIKTQQGKDETVQSYLGLISHGNTKKLQRKVEDERDKLL